MYIGLHVVYPTLLLDLDATDFLTDSWKIINYQFS